MHKKVFVIWLAAGLLATIWAGLLGAAESEREDHLRYLCIGDLAITLAGMGSWSDGFPEEGQRSRPGAHLCAMAGLDGVLPGKPLLGVKTTAGKRGVYVSKVSGTREQAISAVERTLYARGWKRIDMDTTAKFNRRSLPLVFTRSANEELMVVPVSAGSRFTAVVAVVEEKHAK